MQHVDDLLSKADASDLRQIGRLMADRIKLQRPLLKPKEINVGLSVMELVSAYEDYRALLGTELDELAAAAYVHGWRSTRYKQGEVCRERIRLAKEALGLAVELPEDETQRGPSHDS